MRRVTGLANHYCGYAEIAALSSPPEHFLWTPAQASLDSLMLALSSVPVLRTFDPARCAVLTTDDSIDVAATLTQPDNARPQHPVAYESRCCPSWVYGLPAGCCTSTHPRPWGALHVGEC